MSDYCTERHTGLARKRHWCFLCEKPIEPGQPQTYWPCFHDGTHDDIHVHPECLAFLEDWCKYGNCPNDPWMCEGMGPECFEEAMLDCFCRECPDKRIGPMNPCSVGKCGRAAEEVRRIGKDLLEERLRKDAAEIVRRVLADTRPGKGLAFTEKELRELVEKPLARLGLSLDKVEFKEDGVNILVSKDLPRMIDVTVEVEK